MSAKYYIQQYSQQDYFHGGIGAADAEKVLASLGFLPIIMPFHFDFSVRAKIRRLVFILKIARAIPRGSVVVFLFPVYAKMTRLLLSILRKKKVRLVCMIMDVEGIRDADDHLLKSEIRQIRQWKDFVVPNDSMRKVIEGYSPEAMFAVAGLFDFLVTPTGNSRKRGFDIAFAGNLEKSMFLFKLDGIRFNSLRIHVYGSGFPGTAPNHENIVYHGTHSPEVMPKIIEGSFGLVWDGDSAAGCTGRYGEYLRYNSPHKLSLYIISNLPVIIWEEAAAAVLVKKHGIGFTVKSLVEIESVISSMPDAAYRQMQMNMKPLAEKISKGENLENGLRDLLGNAF